MKKLTIVLLSSIAVGMVFPVFADCPRGDYDCILRKKCKLPCYLNSGTDLEESCCFYECLNTQYKRPYVWKGKYAHSTKEGKPCNKRK